MGIILGLGIFVIIALIVTLTAIIFYCLSKDEDYLEGSIILAMIIVIFIISVILGNFIDKPEKFGYQKIEEKVIEEVEEK